MRKKSDVATDLFKQIEIEHPSNIIIKQIRMLISNGSLKPGDRLPPERVLSQKFHIGRGYVREALMKLEFYGIIKTIPKSGSFVAGIGANALEGVITTLLDGSKKNYTTIMELRAPLEMVSVKMAVVRGTAEDFDKVSKVHDRMKENFLNSEPYSDLDCVFHLNIARASHNSLLESFISLLIPDIILMTAQFTDKGPSGPTLAEHEKIVKFLLERDSAKAENAMREHMIAAYQRRFHEKLGLF